MECDNCSICHLQNKTSFPVVWCPHCLEYLCSSCEQQHQVQRMSRHHATISYEDYCKLPSFILNVDLNCQEHNEKYEYFCRSHDVPCCVKCLSYSHKKCDDIPVIDDIVRNVKASAGFEDVWAELKATYETYKVAIETSENNLREIEAKKTEFVTRVNERTNRLIGQLRTIENQTLSVLDSIVRETTDKIEATNKSLRLTEDNLKTMMDKKASIKTHASDYQAFIGIKHIGNEIRESSEDLQKMIKDGGLSKWDVKMEEQDTIEEVIARVKSLGQVQIVEERTTLTLNMDQPNRAQMIVKRGFPPRLKLVQKFQIDDGCYDGCCALPNGIMAFADFYNEEVNITHSNGARNSRVKFTGKGVRAVTVIDSNHIAASNPKAQTISIIEVDSCKIIKTLQTKSLVGGITHHDGYIYFCEPDEGIMKINIASEEQDSVHDDRFVDFYSRLDTDGKRLCYTRCAKNTVTVLDSDYKRIYPFKNDDKRVLNGPRGISFDQHQNMIITNSKNDNLLFIPRDGDKVETLFIEEEGLECPTDVHYSKETNTIIVVCKGGLVRKYSVLLM